MKSDMYLDDVSGVAIQLQMTGSTDSLEQVPRDWEELRNGKLCPNYTVTDP